MDLEALLAAIGTDEAPSDEELDQAHAELKDLLTAAVDPENRDLEAARTLREQIDAIDAEKARRVEASAAEDAEAQKLLEGLTEPVEDEADESDPDEVEVPEAEAEKELVGAGAKADVGKAIKAARSRIQDRPPVEEPTNVKVRAVGAAQGTPLSATSSLDEVARVFADEARGQSKGPLVHMEFEYPQDRVLNSKQALDNTRLIDAVFAEANTSYEAVAAAGGICSPLQADFTINICGDRGRPIRDGLTRFNANRGGIRFSPSVSIADVVAGITVWPIETDESPGVETKACLVLDCEDEVEAKVDAIVACVQIGNFQARFNPEFWRSRLDVLMVAHDRIAEQTLYTDIVANSTAVTYASADGTIYSVLSFIDKAKAGISSRFRLNPGTGFRAILPAWVRDAFRADFAKQRGFELAQFSDVVDAYVNRLFSSRGVTPIWSLDVDVFGAQAAGALLDFPGGDAPITIFPEGTFMFLDGGTLDLGTDITDSTLNQTNDRQAFMETFEKVVLRGCESLTTTVPIDELCKCNVLEVTSV